MLGRVTALLGYEEDPAFKAAVLAVPWRTQATLTRRPAPPVLRVRTKKAAP
jgi:hypothetical protein